MGPIQLKCSVAIAASRESVFDFHQNPQNIRHVLPPFIRVARIDAEAIAKPGDEFVVKLWMPLPVSWRGRWHVVQPPELLVDVALRSPFSYWRHEHRCEEIEGGTLLTERVELRFGEGEPGRLLSLLFGKVPLPVLFRQRQRMMKRYLEQQAAG